MKIEKSLTYSKLFPAFGENHEMAPNAEIDQLELDNQNASKVLKAGNDWYKVLEVPQEFSCKELRKAYLAAEKKVHPDKNKSPDATEASQKVKDAYR